MLALAFYPSSRARRGPLRPSSLKPNTSCGTFFVSVALGDPPQTVRAARVRDASAPYAPFNTAPAGRTPAVAYRQSAINSLRARATMPTRRARFPRPKRS